MTDQRAMPPESQPSHTERSEREPTLPERLIHALSITVGPAFTPKSERIVHAWVDDLAREVEVLNARCEYLDAIARVLDRGIPDDRKLATISRLVNAAASARDGAAAADHPESVCRRCGGANVSWSAPSPLWNAVMRGGSIDGPWEFGELICPTCFCVLAEERGVALDWRVDAEEVRVPLAFVTPSGRRWDPDLWLWVEDTTEVPPCPVCGADLDTSDRAGHLWDEHGTGDEALAAAGQKRETEETP